MNTNFPLILSFLKIINLQPIAILIIFEITALFIYYWDKNFVPFFENVRFSLISKPKKVDNEFIRKFFILFRKTINWIFRINFLYTTIIFYIFLIIWSFFIEEFTQIIFIIMCCNSYIVIVACGEWMLGFIDSATSLIRLYIIFNKLG